MCRLYGILASAPTKVECSLVYAQNGLMSQSRSDMEGLVHADGWGIGCYEDGFPLVERRAAAAFEDFHFSAAAARVYARTVLAHVRQSTVGGSGPSNTHPFSFGPWLFAHNGTLDGFDQLEPILLDQTSPELRALRRGTTDSEAVFLWILTRVAASGVDLAGGSCDAQHLRDVTGEAVLRLAELSATTDAKEPAKLNLMLTNGTILVSSRWHRSLYLVERDSVHDCEICGIPHVGDQTGYRAVVLASEPISHEAWEEVPDHHLVLVPANLRPTITPLRVQSPELGPSETS